MKKEFSNTAHGDNRDSPQVKGFFFFFNKSKSCVSHLKFTRIWVCGLQILLKLLALLKCMLNYILKSRMIHKYNNNLIF